MTNPINSVGFTPNGNVYKKSKTGERVGMAVAGGAALIKKGADFFVTKNILTEESKNADKQSVINKAVNEAIENAKAEAKKTGATFTQQQAKKLAKTTAKKMPLETIEEAVKNAKLSVSDKKTLAAVAGLGIITTLGAMLWGKLIGGFIDDRKNAERMQDADGAEIRVAKSALQLINPENIDDVVEAAAGEEEIEAEIEEAIENAEADADEEVIDESDDEVE